jgi:hypothetical protein
VENQESGIEVMYAETEFEKYRIVQDKLFQNDFDKYLGELPFEE